MNSLKNRSSVPSQLHCEFTCTLEVDHTVYTQSRTHMTRLNATDLQPLPTARTSLASGSETTQSHTLGLYGSFPAAKLEWDTDRSDAAFAPKPAKPLCSGRRSLSQISSSHYCAWACTSCDRAKTHWMWWIFPLKSRSLRPPPQGCSIFRSPFVLS